MDMIFEYVNDSTRRRLSTKGHSALFEGATLASYMTLKLVSINSRRPYRFVQRTNTASADGGGESTKFAHSFAE